MSICSLCYIVFHLHALFTNDMGERVIILNGTVYLRMEIRILHNFCYSNLRVCICFSTLSKQDLHRNSLILWHFEYGDFAVLFHFT